MVNGLFIVGKRKSTVLLPLVLLYLMEGVNAGLKATCFFVTLFNLSNHTMALEKIVKNSSGYITGALVLIGVVALALVSYDLLFSNVISAIIKTLK
jgi:uncharacterized membrane protein (UPF0182 family)